MVLLVREKPRLSVVPPMVASGGSRERPCSFRTARVGEVDFTAALEYAVLPSMSTSTLDGCAVQEGLCADCARTGTFAMLKNSGAAAEMSLSLHPCLLRDVAGRGAL